MHESPYGQVAIAWRVRDGDLKVTLTVPTGATAELDLPGQAPRRLGPGTHSATAALTGHPER